MEQKGKRVEMMVLLLFRFLLISVHVKTGALRRILSFGRDQLDCPSAVLGVWKMLERKRGDGDDGR